MAHSIQTHADIEGMRVAGKLAAECLLMIGEHIKPGVTTGELDPDLPATTSFEKYSRQFRHHSTTAV